MSPIDGALLKSLNLDGAIEAEASAPMFLLPSQQIELAVRKLQDQGAEAGGDVTVRKLANYCRGRFRRKHERHGVDIVLAQKSPKGRRPIHVLSFEQRVLYRALVESLEENPPDADRSTGTWTDFQQGPLADEQYAYIVRTDVVGCYQFIDHDLLIDELVARTGNARSAEAIGDLLGHTVGQRGLPQNVGPSHVLGEYYLDAVERALLRNGHPTWRFSDDIMVASDTWVGISSALEALSDRLRQFGLVINEEKTRFFRQDTYRQWIEDPLDRFRAAGGENLLAFMDDYDPDNPPDDEDRQIEVDAPSHVAVDLLGQSLLSHRVDIPTDRLDAVVNRKVARGALRLLTIARSEAGVELVPDLLRFEPQLTPAVAHYLGSLSTGGKSAAVRHAISACVSEENMYLSPWQSGWLMEPLRSSDTSFDGPLLAWLEAHLISPDSTARAQAASVLAYTDQVDMKNLTALYESAPPAARPEFAAAIALRGWDGDDPAVKSVRRDSPFNDIVLHMVLPA